MFPIFLKFNRFQLQIYEIRKSGTIDNIKMNEGEDAKTDSTIFLLQLKIENKPRERYPCRKPDGKLKPYYE